MTTRKKNMKSETEKPNEDTVVTKAKSSLIFISHDSRDAELAEEFSNLLKSASAGALKSFVSSDKKGTRGIEYGLEWYPAIMDKIDEATEVVCLLTQRSVERPWILYEAGVAKGKLGKKVIGVALGIPHSVAFTGPFAQFQNNDGSVNSITKLVLDLVRKVPGLDPDQQLVEQLVESFNKKANDIITKSQKQKEKSTEEKNENIVAKLFEEVKIMFESLPSRIENKIDPDTRRRRRKFPPMMLDEVMHVAMKSGDTELSFLIMISFFKEEIPWMYEIGMETYRGLKSAKSISEKKKYISNFEKASQLLGHPIFMEFSGSEDIYMLSKELKHFTNRYFNKYLGNEKSED